MKKRHEQCKILKIQNESMQWKLYPFCTWFSFSDVAAFAGFFFSLHRIISSSYTWLYYYIYYDTHICHYTIVIWFGNKIIYTIGNMIKSSSVMMFSYSLFILFK